jgi:hypothetical protein
VTVLRPVELALGSGEPTEAQNLARFPRRESVVASRQRAILAHLNHLLYLRVPHNLLQTDENKHTSHWLPY